MSETVCPNCARSLGPEITGGPSQAVVRCAGCEALLLWANGRVVRSARTSGLKAQARAAEPPPPRTPAPIGAKPAPAGRPAARPSGGPHPAGGPAPATEAGRPGEPPLLALMPEVDQTRNARSAPSSSVDNAGPRPLPKPTPARSAPGRPTQLETLRSVTPPQHVAAPVTRPPQEAEPAPLPPPPSGPARTLDADELFGELPPLAPELDAPIPTRRMAAADLPSGLGTTDSEPTTSGGTEGTRAERPGVAKMAAMLPTPEPAKPTRPTPEPAAAAPNLEPAEPTLPTPEPAAAAPSLEPAKPADTTPAAGPPSVSQAIVPAPTSAQAPTAAPAALAPQGEALTSPRLKRPLVIGIGVGTLLLLGAIWRFAQPGAPTATATPPTGDPAAPTAPPPAAEPPPAVAPAPVAEAPSASPPPPVEAPAAAAPAERPRRLLGGKRVILEYDTKPNAPEPAPPAAAASEDPALLARARDSYRRGNQRLFAGDADGAVTLYRESLSIYPGYVAAYRGLGLAYAQTGKAAEAATALKTYLTTVPSAKDAPLVRRRLQLLEKR